MKNQYKKDYERAKAIYDSLIDQEKQFVSPRGKFVDSDKILFREIIQNDEEQDVGFIDVYEFNNSKQVGFIVMAIHPDFRGQGYSRKLITSAIENCKKLGLRKLIYRCDTENINSIRTIKSDKRFTLITKGKTYQSYEIDLNKYKEEISKENANESCIVFSEKSKIDKDGWYTDKYGNRKLKGDSYYVGMDTNADEEKWKKKKK